MEKGVPSLAWLIHSSYHLAFCQMGVGFELLSLKTIASSTLLRDTAKRYIDWSSVATAIAFLCSLYGSYLGISFSIGLHQ